GGVEAREGAKHDKEDRSCHSYYPDGYAQLSACASATQRSMRERGLIRTASYVVKPLQPDKNLRPPKLHKMQPQMNTDERSVFIRGCIHNVGCGWTALGNSWPIKTATNFTRTTSFVAAGSSRAELRMKTSSEATWMKAASR